MIPLRSKQINKKKLIFHIKTIVEALVERAENSSRQIITFGIILAINYPLYYFIWLYGTSQSYENLFLRLSASFFCCLLIVKEYWPSKLKKIFPVYWYFVVTYSLPFFFTFMVLKNSGSAMWLMNAMSALFFLLLVVDISSAFLLLILGASLGWICYKLTSHSVFVFNLGQVNLLGVISTLFAGFIIGGIFSHNKQILEKEKLQSVRSLSSNIAHELHTPLGALENTIRGLERYFPTLIKAYEIAKEHHLMTAKIRPYHYEILKNLIKDAYSEINYASIIIKILLKNSSVKDIKSAQMETCFISDCIHEMLSHYPFSGHQKNLIHWQQNNDFSFNGNKALMRHVLLNLLKNALYFMSKARKGEITIWAETGDRYNYLHFEDTGTGIPKDKQKHLFKRFFTTEETGTGLGLAFCKMVMQGFNGDITCRSEANYYTHFILSFPPLKP